MSDNTSINVSEELSQSIVVYKNFSTEVLLVDVAKLKNELRDYNDAIKQTRDWISIIALAISLILANCTSNFQEFLGLSSDTWKAIFVIGMAASIIWFVVVLIRLYLNKDKYNVEKLIKSIIDQSETIHNNKL